MISSAPKGDRNSQHLAVIISSALSLKLHLILIWDVCLSLPKLVIVKCWTRTMRCGRLT